MKELFIIAGANGTGKTTLANEILNIYKDVNFVNADEIARNLNNNSILKAGKIAIANIYNLLNKNQSFIIETTLSGNYIEKVINTAKERNYEINLFYIFVDNYNICLERIKNRVLKGGHDVPDKDVIRRYYRSIKNFEKYKNNVNNWNLYYNDTNYPLLIAKMIKQDLIILNDNIYKQFTETMNE